MRDFCLKNKPKKKLKTSDMLLCSSTERATNRTKYVNLVSKYSSQGDILDSYYILYYIFRLS